MEFIFGVIILVVLFIVFRGKKTKEATIVDVTKPYSYSDFELDLIKLINTHRGKNSIITDYISYICFKHNEEMLATGVVSHANFQNRFNLIEKDLKSQSEGEIIEAGLNFPESVLQKFLDSPGHRSILEDPKWTHFGISKYEKYVTIIFAKI